MLNNGAVDVIRLAQVEDGFISIAVFFLFTYRVLPCNLIELLSIPELMRDLRSLRRVNSVVLSLCDMYGPFIPECRENPSLIFYL